jgi:hypothetical protein
MLNLIRLHAGILSADRQMLLRFFVTKDGRHPQCVVAETS